MFGQAAWFRGLRHGERFPAEGWENIFAEVAGYLGPSKAALSFFRRTRSQCALWSPAHSHPARARNRGLWVDEAFQWQQTHRSGPPSPLLWSPQKWQFLLAPIQLWMTSTKFRRQHTLGLGPDRCLTLSLAEGLWVMCPKTNRVSAGSSKPRWAQAYMHFPPTRIAVRFISDVSKECSRTMMVCSAQPPETRVRKTKTAAGKESQSWYFDIWHGF